MLARGPSASTSEHSHVNIDRNNSVTSTNTGGELIIVGPSSSVGISLYRGDSTVSRAGSLPQPYADVKMPIPHEDSYSQDHYPVEGTSMTKGFTLIQRKTKVCSFEGPRSSRNPRRRGHSIS